MKKFLRSENAYKHNRRIKIPWCDFALTFHRIEHFCDNIPSFPLTFVCGLNEFNSGFHCSCRAEVHAMHQKCKLSKSSRQRCDNIRAVSVRREVTHLDWQVLSTQSDHDFDGWERPAGLVVLNGCSHGVLQRGKTGRFIRCWDQNITHPGKEADIRWYQWKLFIIDYLEEFKDHVIQVRGDVWDVDGLSTVVGWRR